MVKLQVREPGCRRRLVSLSCANGCSSGPLAGCKLSHKQVEVVFRVVYHDGLVKRNGFLGNGVACSCCEVEISPSQFESHAGMSARRPPYRHIYTYNELSLHDIAISLANGQNITTGIGDDMCAEGGDGGDLMFFQSCPRAFHAACLDLQDTPEGAWRCPN
ncbi:PREDICTED: uncharacterized protein LOC105113979 [Populus euphratica]|uniref:Uncharacterized protein LOC105113979 n=1 Tax=Populus euphratica TaxID=75702 RepID=A0AAJ6X7W4_POPEU|nr:PREDICTED: uncharacterized protein LOC105113979 [Populus euphratica]